jgi:hypothetical protein
MNPRRPSSPWGVGGLTQKHRLEIEYFELNRDGGNAVDRTLQFGGLTIPVGASVASTSDLGIGRITYAYSFFNDGEKELGAAIGAHIATFDVGVTLNANIGGVAGSSTAESFDITAPLPHVGFVGSYAFTPKFIAEGQLIGFYLSFSEYTGRLLQADLKFIYQMWENVGFGIGVQYFDFALEKDSGSNFQGKYELDFIGPNVFLTIGF